MPVSKAKVFELLGYEPTPLQQEIHDSTERHRIIAAGVRWGKSFVAAHEALFMLFQPGTKGWIVVPEYAHGDEIFKLIRDRLKQPGLAPDDPRRTVPEGFVKRCDNQMRLITTAINSELTVKSASNQDSLMGASLDYCIVDEAARVNGEAMDMARNRLLDRQGWFMAISSPNGHNDFYKFYLRGLKSADSEVDEHPDWRSWHAPTWANPVISAADIEERRVTMPEMKFRQEIAAEFLDDEGTVFKNIHQLAILPVVPGGPEPVPGKRYVVSWDVGRVQDWSVILVWDVAQKCAVHLERFQGSWNSQIQRVAEYARRYSNAEIVMDATGEGDAVHAMMENLNREKPFSRRVYPERLYSAPKKRELIEKLALAMERQEVTFVNHPVLVRELGEYEFARTKTGNQIKYGAPVGHHDDAVISLALGWSLVGRIQSTATFRM